MIRRVPFALAAAATDDPAFNGKKRELTAHDYVYSMKRVLDPKLRATQIAELVASANWWKYIDIDPSKKSPDTVARR